MEGPLVTRYIDIQPAATVTNFLKAGYCSTGVAIGSLYSLASIYGSASILRLANLQTNISQRSHRAGARSPTPFDASVASVASADSKTTTADSKSTIADSKVLLQSTHAFQVVVFKKLNNPKLPTGIDSESLVKFFVSLFDFKDAKVKREFEVATKNHLSLPTYHTLCITALVYDASTNLMVHSIVGAALYMYDHKNGSFIFTLGVLDRGDPAVCSLSTDHFSEHPGASTTEPFLSPSASFRQKGIATFMLSMIQVLGHLGYQPPKVTDPTSYSIPCNENMPAKKKHHLYLQARIEAYSAYTFYVKIGFQLVSKNNVDFHCVHYNDECPVNSNRLAPVGYYTDDVFQRLLSMKEWIYNVYPPESKYTTDKDALPLLWYFNPTQFLSSALVSPNVTDVCLQSTNEAFLSLLDCKKNTGDPPVALAQIPDNFHSSPRPYDKYLPPGRTSQQIIDGATFLPDDVRRTLLRGLNIHHFDYKLGAFEAIAIPLYFEGQPPGSKLPDELPEMTLELRLNLSAFYSRCAHFCVTNHFMNEWANFAIDEFNSLSSDAVSTLGLTSFQSRERWTVNRGMWNENLLLLADRLVQLQPPLSCDLFALQILFSAPNLRPVLFAPVYGLVGETDEPDVTKRFALAQVPDVIKLLSYYGLLTQDEVDAFEAFTIVPIMLLHDTTYGYFSSPLSHTDAELLVEIRTFSLDYTADRSTFKKKPILKIYPDESTFTVGHCASNFLCKSQSGQAARAEHIKCCGCKRPVHAGCGILFADSSIESIQTIITCYLCYDKFGRALRGVADPDYGKAAFKPKRPTKPPDLNPDLSSPSQGTRLKTRSDSVNEETGPKTSKVLFPSARQPTVRSLVKSRRLEDKIQTYNPSFMYPPRSNSPESVGEAWWLDSEGEEPREDVAPGLAYLAEEPVASHVYTQGEMDAWSESRAAKVGPVQTFRQIIKAATDLKKQLAQNSKRKGATPIWMHNPDTQYTDQDLVNLCCLVDRGRSFSVATTVLRKNSMVKLRVSSYQLEADLSFSHYYASKKKAPPDKRMTFTVFRAWLKQYLDWYNPDLYKFIEINTVGVPVLTLPARMAAHDEFSYEQQGIYRNDKLMVPLPKSHAMVTTLKQFGVASDAGSLDPFCLDASSKPPKYNQSLVASCNPSGFEVIPVARAPSINVPAHQLQIRAIRAQVKKGQVRWVGLQGDKYVSLPLEWVQLNFDPGLLAEALSRGTNDPNEIRFVRLPPGDSRLDDPPVPIRDVSGLNYYYQGEKDNCLMGGLANAAFWMWGSEMADQLLRQHIPLNVNCWNSFVQHVQSCVKGYTVKKIVCQNVLEWDDQTPMVVQLRSCDQSETHVICIFNGCIYDSASRFILVKNFESLTWCSGMHGFDCHLRLYQLKMVVSPASGQPKKKRSRWRRSA